MNNNQNVKNDFREIIPIEKAIKIYGLDLYYDTMTNIVYKYDSVGHLRGITIPYFASNGLPYKYNIYEKCLEKIN